MELLLELENETGKAPGFDDRELAQRVAEEVLRQEGCPFERVYVYVRVTGEEEMRVLNRDARGIDAATDVLSFPNLDFPEGAGAFGIPDGREADYLDPDTGELMLGDIVLCWERVRSQAREYGHSVRREFAFLVCHSMLHLCGYDHLGDAEREEMERRQEEILSALGITRDSE